MIFGNTWLLYTALLVAVLSLLSKNAARLIDFVLGQTREGSGIRKYLYYSWRIIFCVVISFKSDLSFIQ